MKASRTRWEKVEGSSTNEPYGHRTSRTFRMAVPGGWLYRNLITEDDGNASGKTYALSMVFVPDPASPARRTR